MISKHEKILYNGGILAFFIILLSVGTKALHLIKEPYSYNYEKILFLLSITILSTVIVTVFTMKLIHQKDKFFKHIFHQANDAMAIIDKSGNYVWQNKANQLLLGYDDDELKDSEAYFFLRNKKVNMKEELEKFEEFSGLYKMHTSNQNSKDVWISAFSIKDDLEDDIFYMEIKRDANSFLNIIDQIKKEKKEYEKKSLLKN